MHCNPCAQCRKLKFYLGGVINASLSGQLYGSCGQCSMIIYEMESLASSYVAAKRQFASFCARLLPHIYSLHSPRLRRIIVSSYQNLHRIWISKIWIYLKLERSSISPNATRKRYVTWKRDVTGTPCTCTCAYTYVCIERSRPRIAVKQCVCNDGRGLNNSVTRTYAGMSDT